MNSYTREKKELDRMAHDAVMLRDKVCQICGGTSHDVHHAIARRSANKTRWSLLNLFAICRTCHTHIHAGKLKDKLRLAINKIATPEQELSIKLQGHEVWTLHHGWINSQKEYLTRKINEYRGINISALNAVRLGSATPTE